VDQRARKLEIIKSEHALVVGVDVGKYRHWACLLDGRTELALGPAFAFQNSGEGFERLVSAVSKAQRKAGATKAVFAMEPAGHYWKPLVWFLKRIGMTVVMVNPFHVKRRKEFDDNFPAKNDRKDAWLVARLANEASFFKVYFPEGVYAELRNLVQARHQHQTKWNMLRRRHGSSCVSPGSCN